MADFNKVVTPGDYENGMINVVVEIPQGSSHKIEWNREQAYFALDRVEPAILQSQQTMALFQARSTKMATNLTYYLSLTHRCLLASSYRQKFWAI